MTKQKENKSRDKRLILTMNKMKLSSIFFLLSLLLFTTLFSMPKQQIAAINGRNAARNNGFSAQELTVEFTELAHYPASRSIGFAMRDEYVYSIMGYNPSIIDISNKSNPTLVAEYPVANGRMNTLALQDDCLFLGSSTNLEILNISDPQAMTEVSYCNFSHTVHNIILQDNYAYLAAAGSGLVIINISDVTKPTIMSYYNTNIIAWNLAVKDSLVYVTNLDEMGQALEIINVSDPENPTKIGSYEDTLYPEMHGSSITINGNIAYLGTSRHGLFILDISTPAEPTLLGHFYGNTGDGIIWMTKVVGQYLFVAAGMAGLFVLDIADQMNYKQIAFYDYIDSLNGVFVKDSYLFTQGYTGLMIFNFTFVNLPTDFDWITYTFAALIVAVAVVVAIKIIKKR
jgi:hypothetical protein